jgi:hypothetical protein
MGPINPESSTAVYQALSTADAEKAGKLAIALLDTFETRGEDEHQADIVLAAIARMAVACAAMFSRNCAASAARIGQPELPVPTRDETLVALCAYARALGSAPPGDAPMPPYIHEAGRA